jgi:hypothetical protein
MTDKAEQAARGRAVLICNTVSFWSTRELREEVEKQIVLAITDATAAAIARAEQAEKERDHWKANHDKAVATKRAVLDRPDLKERAALVVALEQRAEQAESRLAVAAPKGCVVDDEGNVWKVCEAAGWVRTDCGTSHSWSVRLTCEAALATQAKEGGA